MENKYLVIYDITDSKRINKVAAILLDYGIRIQKSVFEVCIHDENLRKMKMRLHAAIDQDLDGIKIFQLCESCVARRRAVGKVRYMETAAPWTVI